MQRTWTTIVATSALLFVSVACSSTDGATETQQLDVRASRPAAVEEIQHGLLKGYLEMTDLPSSLALVPPPPAGGSAAFARDVEVAEATFALRGTERWTLAQQDAVLEFPAAAGVFSDALGFEITEAETPYLYQLLRRTLTDAGLSTYTAKNNYARERPFMVNGEPIGTPQDEELLRKDGSYPSGHTAIGWAWALILCELVPERTDALLARGWQFGDSRSVCNVHWQSDIDTGRIMGAAAVARLHANGGFLADMEAARGEILRLE